MEAALSFVKLVVETESACDHVAVDCYEHFLNMLYLVLLSSVRPADLIRLNSELIYRRFQKQKESIPAGTTRGVTCPSAIHSWGSTPIQSQWGRVPLSCPDGDSPIYSRQGGLGTPIESWFGYPPQIVLNGGTPNQSWTRYLLPHQEGWT